MIGWRFSFF